MTRSRSKQVLADFSVPQDRVVQCLLVATFVDPFDGYTRMHMDTYGYVHIHTDTHTGLARFNNWRSETEGPEEKKKSMRASQIGFAK